MLAKAAGYKGDSSQIPRLPSRSSLGPKGPHIPTPNAAGIRSSPLALAKAAGYRPGLMELPTFTVTLFAKLWAYGRIPTLMSKATNDQGSPIAPAWVCLRALFQSAKVTPKALARNPKANETKS